MASFSTTVGATTNVASGTEDSFIDITPPAGVSILVKRFRISIRTAASDDRFRFRLIRKSVQGTGSVVGTIVEKRPDGPAAVSTIQVKTGVTAFLAGTLVDLVDEIEVNGRAIFEWVPRGPEEVVMSRVAEIIGLNVFASANSIEVDVTIEWEE